ncbi:hypothetical protein [Spiroplasma endosymbiont of Labia minor]|uniref:hypothetical protein n=1 Tax=Spiroplasma endosymbiont of Labia minor TaxID=3066305 RepID=UPI0030D15D64
MAKITGDEIVFTPEEETKAWENAVALENKEPDEMKMCWICKFYMIYKDKYSETGDIFNWAIDLINAKKKPLDLNSDNLIAVHYNCINLRQKTNATKLLTKIKLVKWKFDEDFYSSDSD